MATAQQVICALASAFSAMRESAAMRVAPSAVGTTAISQLVLSWRGTAASGASMVKESSATARSKAPASCRRQAPMNQFR